MLHIIAKSPFSSNTLEICLRLISAEDVIVLIEDGVLATLIDSAFTQRIRETAAQCKIYALKPDVEARGILSKTLEEIQLIDYESFVDLTLKYHPIQSWY